MRSFRDYTWRSLERNYHNVGVDMHLLHSSIADDVDLNLCLTDFTEYVLAFDADVEWRPRSNVTNQYRSQYR